MFTVLIVIILITSYIIYNEVQNRKLLETVTKTYRGTKSERNLVLKLLKSGIPSKAIFHDLYIKKQNNTYCQIDLVVTTDVGIIVFEVKDYGGWIFGTGNNTRWTQVLAYGKVKNSFYNPIMQNDKHISDLRNSHKHFKSLPIYSVIVFYGDSIFKNVSSIPSDVSLIKSNKVIKLINRIINDNLTVFTESDEAMSILRNAVQNGESVDIQNQHIVNVREMLSRYRNFN